MVASRHYRGQQQQLLLPDREPNLCRSGPNSRMPKRERQSSRHSLASSHVTSGAELKNALQTVYSSRGNVKTHVPLQEVQNAVALLSLRRS